MTFVVNYSVSKMYIVLSICVCAIVLLFTFLNKWRESRRPFYALAEQLPGPKALPLLGNALTFMCGKTELFSRTLDLLNSHPKNMSFWLGPDLMAVFTNPDHVASILKSSKFNSKHDNLIYFQEYFGNGLISASGPIWKEHRKIIQPLFHQKFIRQSMGIVQKHADILIGKLQLAHVNSNNTFNVNRFFNYCAADLTSEILFGESLNTQNEDRNRHLATVGEDLYCLTFERIMKVWLQPKLLHRFTLHRNKGLHVMKQVDDYLTSVIEKSKSRVQAAATNDLDAAGVSQPDIDLIPPTVDLLTLYLEESGYNMDEQDFKHHLLSLYTAGEDPITIAMGFTCMLLGMNPQYQEIAAEEIGRVFGNSPRIVQYEDLKELTYLERCIKEILRIVPIGPFILRQPHEDVQLGEYSIPKGCAVLIPVVRLHRDPDQWERPNDFYPDHFRPEFVAKRHPCAYIPFSAGHRICIGQSLALTSLKVLMVNILQHFRIECDGKFSDIQLMSDLSIRPINGYNIRVFTKATPT